MLPEQEKEDMVKWKEGQMEVGEEGGQIRVGEGGRINQGELKKDNLSVRFLASTTKIAIKKMQKR